MFFILFFCVTEPFFLSLQSNFKISKHVDYYKNLGSLNKVHFVIHCINPRRYAQTYSTIVVQGGLLQPLP